MSIDDATEEEWNKVRASMNNKCSEGPFGVPPASANPLLKQVGGAHYKSMDLQPIEACYARYGYRGVKAALHTKIDNYLTREKTDEWEDLEKGEHCFALLKEFYRRSHSKELKGEL